MRTTAAVLVLVLGVPWAQAVARLLDDSVRDVRELLLGDGGRGGVEDGDNTVHQDKDPIRGLPELVSKVLIRCNFIQYCSKHLGNYILRDNYFVLSCLNNIWNPHLLR